MKTSNITKWTTLLTVSGILSIASLTVTAQTSLFVNSTNYGAESGKAYAAPGLGQAALQVYGTSAAGTNGSYSGTGLILSATFHNSNGSHAVLLDYQASAALYSSTVTASGTQQSYAIFARGTSALYLEDVTVSSGTGNYNYGVNIDYGASLVARNIYVTTAAGIDNYALNLRYGATFDIDGGSVNSTSRGIDVQGTLTLKNFTIVAATAGIVSNYAVSSAELDHVTIEAAHRGLEFYSGGTMVVRSSTISGGTHGLTTTGNGGAQVTFENSDLTGNANAVHFTNGNNSVTFSGGNVSGSNAVWANNASSGTNTVGFAGTQAGGDLNNSGSGTLNVNLNSSALTGNLITSNSATLTVNLDNSTLTGISTVSDSGVTNLTLRNNSNWNMTSRSKLTTLHGDNGSITIDNVEGEDLIVSGGISGQTALNLTLSDNVKGDQEIWVVVDETNAMSNSAFVLGREVSAGMYQYKLVNETDGAWLVYTGTVSGTNPPPTGPDTPPVIPPVPSGPPVISSEGDVVINTAAAVAGFWFTQLDNLHKRMGELRYNKSADGDVLDNVWIRAYGQQINANTGIYSVKGFTETQYGVDLGTDHLWNLDADNQLYTGIFAGYGGADRQFHSSYNGSTDSGYGGLYATWLNNSGWYADIVAKGQYFRNDFDGSDHGKYDSLGVGFSVEFGRQFEFKDGWFAEPSVQVSYLHLMNDNYTTRDGMNVTLSDADVLHFYGGARLGRNIKLTNSGFLQPYIKIGGLEQISSGNKVTVSGDHWRPNLDGARAIIGTGIVWQLDADNQLHFDYEASFGDKYDKPWGLNFGYRHQF